MKRILRKYTALFAILVVLAITFIGASVGRAQERKDAINIGCKNFTEQQVIAEMVSILLEEKYGASVNRVFNLDGTLVAFEALQTNNIDVFMDYTGTMLTEILRETDFADKDNEWIDQELLKKHNIRWLYPLGYNNTYALLVSEDTNLRSIDDIEKLLKENPKAKIAVSHEFHARPEFAMLQKNYPYFDRAMDLDECFVYLTVANRGIDVGVGYETDGRIDKYKLRSLEDTKKALPDYKAVFAVHNTAYEKYPQLQSALSDLEGKISDREIRKLNDRVDTDHITPYQVAKEFLVDQGILP